MNEDKRIETMYELETYIELAEKADALYIERYDIWQMDRTALKAFAKAVEARFKEKTQ
jgi:hypothetical protein